MNRAPSDAASSDVTPGNVTPGNVPPGVTDAADRRLVDITDRRGLMVDGQLRPNRVSDSRVLGAMRSLPRERFVPQSLAALAYADEDVRLPGGRYLLEPLTLARLVQLANPLPGERVLVVGAGTGYGAAVLAATGATVVALEEDTGLQAIARTVLTELVPAVQLVSGPLAAGWQPGVPYDLVFIEGGFEQLPPAIAAQVRPNGGRVVGVCLPPGEVGRAVLGERAGEAAAISLRPEFDCSAAVLPGLHRAPGFVF